MALRRFAGIAAIAAASAVASLESCCDCNPTGVRTAGPTGDYTVSVRNEEAQGDPARFLTTNLRFTGSNPQVSWDRDDSRSYLVQAISDNNSIGVYSAFVPEAVMDNINHARTVGEHLSFSLAGNLGVQPNSALSIADQLAVALRVRASKDSVYKWGSTLIITENGDSSQIAEERQMQRWLWPESDPFGKATIRPNGTDSQGNHIYRIALYRQEADFTINRELSADLNFGTGALTRVDSLSNLSGPYSKIGAGCADSSGFIQMKYGVDNRSTASSQLYRPELIAPGCWPGR